MERFIIEVENGKAEFFKDLIKNFDFVEIVKEDNIVEPRIYPATDFEIKPHGHISNSLNKSKSTHAESKNLNKGSNSYRGEEQNLEQIRDAISAINRVRDKNR